MERVAQEQGLRRAGDQSLRLRVLGGLSALAVLACQALLACQGSEAPPEPRTSAVTAKATASAVAAPTSTASVASKPRRDPCLGQELRDPPGALERGRATGGASAPSPLSYGKRWTWVNVWAAWCEPCKKEMPMLLRWRDELRKKGVAIDLVFLSIDDDERELMRFLDGQSQLKSTYWLEGEEAQASWFESVGITGSPKLPVHAFVSPDAKTACVISGSVEEGDYAAIARLTGG